MEIQKGANEASHPDNLDFYRPQVSEGQGSMGQYAEGKSEANVGKRGYNLGNMAPSPRKVIKDRGTFTSWSAVLSDRCSGNARSGSRFWSAVRRSGILEVVGKPAERFAVASLLHHTAHEDLQWADILCLCGVHFASGQAGQS